LLVLKWFDGDAERHYDERDGNRYRIHDGGYQRAYLSQAGG
jgi:hypothetical protein